MIPNVYGLITENEMRHHASFSSTVTALLGGCNLRCPYCTNNDLLLEQSLPKPIEFDQIIDTISNNDFEWFMISGGEPTCTDILGLLELISAVKQHSNCKIAMGTNGSNSKSLLALIDHLNYVVLSLLGSSRAYAGVHGGMVAKANVLKGLEILFNKINSRENFDGEVRTLLYPPYINEKDISIIGEFFEKDKLWVFQQFNPTNNMLDIEQDEVKPFEEKEIEKIVSVARKYTDRVEVIHV